MPNIKSAKKRMKLSAQARTRNRSERARIRTAIKRVRDADSADLGQERLRDAVALLDRAATRRLVHPNRVARIKSGLTRHVQALAS
jgi:small subunit ribosomal protein S20